MDQEPNVPQPIPEPDVNSFIYTVIVLIKSSIAKYGKGFLKVLTLFLFGVFCGMGIVLTHKELPKDDTAPYIKRIDTLEKQNNELQKQLQQTQQQLEELQRSPSQPRTGFIVPLR